jgi:hypothetical protein
MRDTTPLCKRYFRGDGVGDAVKLAPILHKKVSALLVLKSFFPDGGR